MLAILIVETIVHMVAELLEADIEERDMIIDRTERQLRVILLGVPEWEVSRTGGQL